MDRDGKDGGAMSELVELIKTFGYPVAVSIYLFWRLDKSEDIVHTQQKILETQERHEEKLNILLARGDS